MSCVGPERKLKKTDFLVTMLIYCCMFPGEADSQVAEFHKVMLDFVKMEQDLQQFQQAVEYVKSQVRLTTIINL